MELAKLTKEEIKGLDKLRLREVEQDIRRELAMLRIDLYQDKKQSIGKVRNLKKNLARVLTFNRQLQDNSEKQS